MVKKVGRPRKTLTQKDYKTFEKLAGLMCSEKEIAAHFNMDFRTLKKAVEQYSSCDFCTVYKKAQSAGNIRLRSVMFSMASKNAAVAIFLAKNHLGMKDVPLVEEKVPKVRFEIHE